ncbi:MAG: hypothetical protein CMF96_09950 [Candidatus Marinimicrobia bacterium]|nr:hypothetical protein [Candidatus Neomarinimicrobiota bacterium]
MQTPQIINYFENVISKVGVIINESNEKFTLEHNGVEILLYHDICDDVAYIINLNLNNIENIVSHAYDGKIDNQESWKIINVLFTPMFKSTFQLTMNNNWRKKLSNLEEITHTYLYSFDKKELIGKHTIINKSQLVEIKLGIQGEANRVYKLDSDNALIFQKKMQKAIINDNWYEWLKFAKWYRDWQEDVSILIK